LHEFKLPCNELIVLLNLLYNSNNHRFIIRPYTLNSDLLEIKLEKGAQLSLFFDNHSYYNRIQEFIDFPEIIPDFKIVREILIGSGFLEFKNHPEFMTTLKNIKTIDPLKGERITCIGLDTNCYINRVYTLIEKTFQKDLSKFYFITSRIIKTELMEMRKISAQTIQNFIQALHHQHHEILRELWNAETVNNRIKHIGLIEYNKLRKNTTHFANDGIHIHDQRDKDFQIIEDFRNQLLNKNLDLLILTSDKQFYEQAREPGIRTIYLELPSLNDIPATLNGNWEQLTMLIYLTAIYYGAISFRGNNTIQIFGVWRGKTAKDWDEEIIKLRIGSESLAQHLTQQLKILYGNL